MALRIELPDLVPPVCQRVLVPHQPFLEILGDRKREPHDDKVRRAGGGIDPHGFALNRINATFKDSKRQRR